MRVDDISKQNFHLFKDFSFVLFCVLKYRLHQGRLQIYFIRNTFKSYDIVNFEIDVLSGILIKFKKILDNTRSNSRVCVICKTWTSFTKLVVNIIMNLLHIFVKINYTIWYKMKFILPLFRVVLEQME